MPKSKSRKKKMPKRVLALPDLEHAKTAVLNSSDGGQWPTDLRVRDSRVRGVVLLGAQARVQSHRCAPLPDPPRATRTRTGDDQSSVGRCSPHRVRGRRRRSPEPRAGGLHSPGERGAADWWPWCLPSPARTSRISCSRAARRDSTRLRSGGPWVRRAGASSVNNAPKASSWRRRAASRLTSSSRALACLPPSRWSTTPHQRAGRSPGDDRRRREHGIGRSRETLPRRTRRLDS